MLGLPGLFLHGHAGFSTSKGLSFFCWGRGAIFEVSVNCSSTHIPDFQRILCSGLLKLSELFCAVASEHAEFPMFSLMM